MCSSDLISFGKGAGKGHFEYRQKHGQGHGDFNQAGLFWKLKAVEYIWSAGVKWYGGKQLEGQIIILKSTLRGSESNSSVENKLRLTSMR